MPTSRPSRGVGRPHRRGGGRPARALLGVGLVLAVLAGCGGGGGGSGGPDGGAGGSAPAVDASKCPAGLANGAGPIGTATSHGAQPRAPFLVDPQSQAALAAAKPGATAAVRTLAATPTAFPVGDWITDVTGQVHARAAAATGAGATAVFMVYAIPHRDVGAGFSAGGLPNAAAYRQFTRQVAAGIGSANAVIVLEPDSLGQIDQLDAGEQAERYALLNDAVDVYGALPGTSVYLDGANCGWTPAPEIAQRLVKAGVERARGFAVNVANYYRTEDEAARAEVVSRLTGGAHYVVDTSRNGRGPAGGSLRDAWCNPPGRGLGAKPTTETGLPRADAFLWVKTPGASDGDCGRNDPSAGTWWPAQAEELVRNAAN